MMHGEKKQIIKKSHR